MSGKLPQSFAPSDVGTRLITRADDLRSFTANQETDARTALTRGLAEYLSTLEWQDYGGRFLRLERVFDTWPEAEEEAVYPSACVRAEGSGEYGDSKLTPMVQSDNQLGAPDNRYVVSPCEFGIDLVIELRAADPEARSSLCSMLELGLSPLDWRYGILLELPHYFNQRASYEMKSMSYTDGSEVAMQRLRGADFMLRANVPVTRLMTLPLARIKTKTEVSPDAGIIKGVAGKRIC